MLKNKITTITLICFIFHLYGCSSSSEITKEELTNEYFQKGKKPSLEISTVDSVLFKIDFNTYSIITDTLFGKGQAIDPEGRVEEFDGKIPFDKIITIEKSTLNYAPVAIMAVMVIAIFSLVMAIIQPYFSL
jgi:hypothetical protein